MGSRRKLRRPQPRFTEPSPPMNYEESGLRGAVSEPNDRLIFWRVVPFLKLLSARELEDR
jgi:hypothetical protein